MKQVLELIACMWTYGYMERPGTSSLKKIKKECQDGFFYLLLRITLLEPIQSLRSRIARKAKWMSRKLVL